MALVDLEFYSVAPFSASFNLLLELVSNGFSGSYMLALLVLMARLIWVPADWLIFVGLVLLELVPMVLSHGGSSGF